MNQELLMRIALMLIIPFLLVVAIIPYIKKVAKQINAIDIPRGRHIHKKPTPKLGGVAIFLGFLFGYMIFGTPSASMNAILIGSFILVLVGVIDDITELSAKTQFIGQLVAASIVVFYGKLLIQDISAFGIYIEFGWWSYPITLFFILGCINCINLIDGLDGLSGGISAIYFLTIGIIATIQGKTGLDFVLAFVMAGSILGFLVYNFNPASIFAGDAGSMLMGFMISVVALFGFKNVTMSSLIIPLFVIAIPILDTLFAILRRTINIIYIIDILFATASIVYVLKDALLGYIIYGILLVIVITFVATTNVVVDKDDVKKKFKEKIDNLKNKSHN